MTCELPATWKLSELGGWVGRENPGFKIETWGTPAMEEFPERLDAGEPPGGRLEKHRGSFTSFQDDSAGGPFVLGW